MQAAMAAVAPIQHEWHGLPAVSLTPDTWDKPSRKEGSPAIFAAGAPILHRRLERLAKAEIDLGALRVDHVPVDIAVVHRQRVGQRQARSAGHAARNADAGVAEA